MDFCSSEPKSLTLRANREDGCRTGSSLPISTHGPRRIPRRSFPFRRLDSNSFDAYSKLKAIGLISPNDDHRKCEISAGCRRTSPWLRSAKKFSKSSFRLPSPKAAMALVDCKVLIESCRRGFFVSSPLTFVSVACSSVRPHSFGHDSRACSVDCERAQAAFWRSVEVAPAFLFELEACCHLRPWWHIVGFDRTVCLTDLQRQSTGATGSLVRNFDARDVVSSIRWAPEGATIGSHLFFASVFTTAGCTFLLFVCLTAMQASWTTDGGALQIVDLRSQQSPLNCSWSLGSVSATERRTSRLRLCSDRTCLGWCFRGPSQLSAASSPTNTSLATTSRWGSRAAIFSISTQECQAHTLGGRYARHLEHPTRFR